MTAFFLFCTIALFAQPQKGDLYVGSSNFRLNSTQNLNFGFPGFNNSFLSFSPSFGKFVADNTLIGGGFSLFSSFFPRRLGSNSGNSSSFGLRLFSTQYIGKGKLKGLGQLTLNSNLSKNEFSTRNITGDFALGGAYFINEFTSLQLSYNINIFNLVEGSDIEYLTSGITPRVGLSMRTLLLRNREGIENLSALNSIKKGTMILSTSGGLIVNSPVNSRSVSSAFSYFFADNFYARANFSASRNKNEQNEFEFKRINGGLLLGSYFRITKKLYTKLSTELNTRREVRSSQFNFSGTISNLSFTTNALYWNSEFGLVFFLGQHKLESGIGYRFSNTGVEEIDSRKRRGISPNLFIRHEWFLAENFAFTSAFDLRYNNVNYSVGFSGFSSTRTEQDLSLVEFSQNTIGLNVGFKWYLSTPAE